jgi:hypothetical protein
MRNEPIKANSTMMAMPLNVEAENQYRRCFQKRSIERAQHENVRFLQ